MSIDPHASPPLVLRRSMVGRSPDEEHRTATSLELFFDMCFVVAVSQAAAGLHHAISEGHVAYGVTGYLMVFFAVWWAWMNFTWFSSAFDNGDVAYRLTVLGQIGGALIFASGVPRALDERDFAVCTLGYVVMRLAMVLLWLRAARSDPLRRRACLRFAVGVTLVQVGWVLRLALPESTRLTTFALLVVAELAVPIWAERAERTPWHPHHIAERYGLFTLIVLGESVLASTVAIQSALDTNVAVSELAATAVGGLLVVFSMWWLYFAKDAAGFLTSSRAGFVWGYGHYVIFGSAAAVGAGIAVTVDQVVGEAHLSRVAAAAAVTVPVATFVLGVWVLQWLPQHLRGWHVTAAPAVAALVLLSTFSPQPLLVTGLLMVALVTAGVVAAQRLLED